MIFKKETFKNLLESGVNSLVPELTVEERKIFFEALEYFGLKKNRARLRIFRTGFGSGFEEWELIGIRNIIRSFCEQEGMPVPTEKDLPMFYLEALEGRRSAFQEFVNPLGIGKNCAIYRFKNWNFQEWELMGMREVIERICNEKVA